MGESIRLSRPVEPPDPVLSGGGPRCGLALVYLSRLRAGDEIARIILSCSPLRCLVSSLAPSFLSLWQARSSASQVRFKFSDLCLVPIFDHVGPPFITHPRHRPGIRC